ncbi:hypothetical protein [Pectobacterium betavasculorum]|uniref:hypothetical protein n=1 Tax=Pectobacterium betavasculorum TaxID=55207 RepID=UPI000A9D93B4|nr:hypothetical protein [Pectobacterium betavasculorum]
MFTKTVVYEDYSNAVANKKARWWQKLAKREAEGYCRPDSGRQREALNARGD